MQRTEAADEKDRDTDDNSSGADPTERNQKVGGCKLLACCELPLNALVLVTALLLKCHSASKGCSKIVNYTYDYHYTQKYKKKSILLTINFY